MFESAELGHQVDPADYKAEVPGLRAALLDAQYDLLQSGAFPLIIVVGGVDGAGKGETINKLNEWMDPRHILTTAFPPPTTEEAERPRMWRYWQVLPPRGRIAIYFGSWYTEPIAGRVYGDLKQEDLSEALQEVTRFEKLLADEGALLLKFWFHLSKDRQKERIKKLEGNPLTSWRVSEQDKRHLKHYDEFRTISEEVLRETSAAHAPWIIVEGFDANYRNLTVGRHILQALRERLDRAPAPPEPATTVPPVAAVDRATLLSSLDLTLALDKKLYGEQLEALQGRLNQLTRDPRFAGISVVCVFEGWDAAGKGGAIRRITQAVDARQYRVIPISAPTEEELAQPYLWRFWRHIPRHGRLTLFDRSWYGRVLVERVEGLCREHDWMRAYAEINDFEQQLTRNRHVVVKFWLHISKDEQLRRFEEREQTPYKRFKITEQDWRNREKRDDYEAAVCDMIDRTSVTHAPWTIVEAEDKNYARIKVLRTLCERIEQALKAS